jgi:hypothetical protein
MLIIGPIDLSTFNLHVIVFVTLGVFNNSFGKAGN